MSAPGGGATETRAGVAERWISAQAGQPASFSPSSSPRHSNASSPRAGSWSGNVASPSSASLASAAPGSYSFGAPALEGGYGNTAHGAHFPTPPPGLSPYSAEPGLASHSSKYSWQIPPLNLGYYYQQQQSSHNSLNFHGSNPAGRSSGQSLLRTSHPERSQSKSKEISKDLVRDFSESPQHSFLASGNEKLYEAYSELHSLAQDFHKPFDAPAILVVGHQTDGKSALVEALMGFQFNHVGGGTKTRRPITLHMTYNAECTEPRCFLISEDSPPKEEEKPLDDLQAYIESENMRLALEPSQFWAKEIVVKIEYRFCPNLTIIDTPGLISAAPGRKNISLQSQAKAVEALVRSKMQQKEFIILCLEDCSDWTNATTRRFVMQMDPELTRTVIVSTKLDTRIPQFARPADVELFLRPPSRLLDGSILGDTPFFTSVPSGRVGSGRDSVYRSNESFREAVAMREALDVSMLEEKMDRPLTLEERYHVGISRLRCFLEQLLQRRYLDSVPTIVPLLDKEYRLTAMKLQQTVQDLANLNEAKLKERGRLFRDSFLSKLSLLLKGTVVAPPEKFGEALQDERVHGGAFTGPDGVQIAPKNTPNAGMRLYGGAQYHRAMAEFRFVVGGVKCPPISREEIVNACGVEDTHDGTNYFRVNLLAENEIYLLYSEVRQKIVENDKEVQILRQFNGNGSSFGPTPCRRTACVIAVSKARDVFEPFLHQLGFRLSHILRRLLPIALFLLQKDGEYLSGHDMFMKRVATAFHMFVESTERNCREKCMEDLISTTRYVTWSLHNKHRSALRSFLDNLSTSEQTFAGVTTLLENTVTVVSNSNKQDNNKARQQSLENGKLPGSAEGTAVGQTAQARLVDLLESTLWNRRLAPTSEEIVNALVQQLFEGIRDHFVAAAELKFNCFFLMPVVDKFPALLREDLESAFVDDIDNVFNVGHARRSLEQRRRDLEIELQRVERLQEKFASIHQRLGVSQPHPVAEKDVCEAMTSLNVQGES